MTFTSSITNKFSSFFNRGRESSVKRPGESNSSIPTSNGNDKDVQPPYALTGRIENARARVITNMNTSIPQSSGTAASVVNDANLPDTSALEELMQSLVDRKHERSMDAEAARIEARIEQIKALKESGEMTEQQALDATAEALSNKGVRDDLAKRVARNPVLRTAICDLMAALPLISSGQMSVLILFAKSINDDFQSRSRKDFPTLFPEFTQLRLAYESFPGGVKAVRDAVKKNERIECTEMLKEGVDGLLRVVSNPQNLDAKVRAYAVEMLTMIRQFADRALAEKITKALKGLTVEDLRSCIGLLFSPFTFLAREHLIGDFHQLPREEQSTLIETISWDICIPEQAKHDGRGLKDDDYPPLFKNVMQLLSAVADVEREQYPREVSVLAAKCLLLHHDRLDEEMRAACVDAARKLPLEELAQTILNSSYEHKKDVLMALAPAWNGVLKELKEKADPTSDDEMAQISVLKSLATIGKYIADKEAVSRSDRVAILVEFVDGFKSLGAIQGGSKSAQTKRLNVLAPLLTHGYGTDNDEERGVVLKLKLAFLNDTSRLDRVLGDPAFNPKYIPVLKQLVQKSEEFAQTVPPVFIAQELNNLTVSKLAELRLSLQNNTSLKPKQRDDAISFVDELERRIAS